VLVQAVPLVGVPLMLALFPAGRPGGGWLVAATGCYVAARACELLDASIFVLTGVVSGHTLKHLAGAAGAAAILHWMGTSRPVLSSRP
jgi:hypothetical protein